MTVFDDFERIDPNPSYPLERTYAFYNRVQNTEYAKIRNIINQWFSEYPQKNKKKLLADFRVSFYSAFYELLIYSIFKNIGYNVVIEPSDENIRKTPDFLCFDRDVSFYLECTVTDGSSESYIKIENIKSRIYEKMSKLDTPNFFLNIELLNLKSNRQPKTKYLIYKIQEEINKISGIYHVIDFENDESRPRVYFKMKILKL